MLSKKRDNFRQTIRRKELSSYFQKIRQEMMNQQSQEKSLKQQSQASAFINEKWQSIEHHFKVMDYFSVFSILDQINVALSQQNALFSKSIMSIMKRFGPMLSKIIQNENVVQDSQEEEEKKKIKLKMDIQHILIAKMFVILLRINFNFCDKSQISTLFTHARQLFNASDLLSMILPGSEKDTYLDLILQLINSLLALHDLSVMKILKNQGLSMHLIRIFTDAQKGLHLSDSSETQIMVLLSEYLDLQSQNQKRSVHELGIQIVGCQSTENSHFMAVCLSNIHHQKQYLFESSLKSLSHIFTMHEYLIDSVKQQNLREICILIAAEDRKVQLQATQVMNDIIYFNNRASQFLLKKSYITDILTHRLRQQNTINDPFSKQIIKNCAYILCNLVIVQMKDLKTELKDHQIWNLAYESLQPSCKLYPIVVVFEYYFEYFGRKKTLNILDSFLQAVQWIDLSKEQPEQKSLRNAILRMNIHKQYWSEKEEEAFYDMLEKYKLKHVLDDQLMEE